MRHSPLILPLLVAAAALPMPGQPAAQPEPVLELTLRRAVELALAPDGNVRAQLAEESIRQTAARSLEARAALLPNLDGTFGLRNQTQNLASFGFTFPTIPGISIPSFVGPFTVFDARLTASMSLFDYASLKRYQAAKRTIDAAKADRDATRDQISQQVARAYLSAVRADDTVSTSEANLDLSVALLKLARNQKDAGTGTGIDVVRAQVQEANDRQRLVVSRNDRDNAYLNLRRAIGIKLSTELKLSDRMAYLPVDSASIDSALEAAHGSREELKAQAKRTEVAQINYSASKAELLPTVGALADVGPVGTTVDNARTTRSYGLSVKIPIWDSGRRAGRREENASALKQEQLRLKDLREQVDLEVRQAANGLRSAENQIAVAKEGLALSEQELAQARRRYENGVASSIEVTDAQTRLQRARDNQIAAVYAHNLARIDWFAAMGKIESGLDQH
jgi:outer membrane protein